MKKFFCAVALFMLFFLLKGSDVSASEKFIMMGDSYSALREGTSYSGESGKLSAAWPDYVIRELQLEEPIVKRMSGYGFIRENRQFITALEAIPDSTEVTCILLVGGVGNDYHASGHGSRSRIEKAMEEFDAAAKRKFPNARILYSAPNWGVKEARRYYCNERAPWYIEKSEALGWQYLYGTEIALRVNSGSLKSVFFNDGIHPTQKGQELLGKALIAAIRLFGS